MAGRSDSSHIGLNEILDFRLRPVCDGGPLFFRIKGTRVCLTWVRQSF
jgi:hypothetical protein